MKSFQGIYVILSILTFLKSSGQKKHVDKLNSIFNNVGIEGLGMYSINTYGKPVPNYYVDPVNSGSLVNLSGYVANSTYSYQFGITKRLSLKKKVGFKFGLHIIQKNYFYTKPSGWIQSQKFGYFPEEYFETIKFLTITEYIEYNIAKNDFICLGFQPIAYIITSEVINFENIFSKLALNRSFLLRYERELYLYPKGKLSGLVELDFENFRCDYIQFKVGINYKLTNNSK
jgi:hypothetical protein